MVMLVPLYALAAGSILAGWPFYEYFAGHHVQEFFRQSIVAEAAAIIDAIHHVPLLVKVTPFVMMLIGFAVAYHVLYPRSAHPGAARARTTSSCTASCSTSGISTSCTTSSSCARPSGSATTLWKRGDGWLIDGFGPDGVSARVLDVTRNVVRLQTGYLYHYAFAMLIGAAALITWFMFAGVR